MDLKQKSIGALGALALVLTLPLGVLAGTRPTSDRQPNAVRDLHLNAAIAAAPRRGWRSLCRMSRAPRHFVWLDKAGCTAQGRAVELLQQMPDSDVVGLLERQASLLASARLLFAGNTSCAPGRAFNYSLSQMDLGAVGSSSEVMAALLYTSDRNTTARVWVKRSGVEYTAWNVHCESRKP